MTSSTTTTETRWECSKTSRNRNAASWPARRHNRVYVPPATRSDVHTGPRPRRQSAVAVPWRWSWTICRTIRRKCRRALVVESVDHGVDVVVGFDVESADEVVDRGGGGVRSAVQLHWRHSVGSAIQRQAKRVMTSTATPVAAMSAASAGRPDAWLAATASGIPAPVSIISVIETRNDLVVRARYYRARRCSRPVGAWVRLGVLGGPAARETVAVKIRWPAGGGGLPTRLHSWGRCGSSQQCTWGRTCTRRSRRMRRRRR